VTILLHFCVLSLAAVPQPAPAAAYTPGPIRIDPPYLEGSLLFPEELRPIMASVARFLTEQGYSVVDLDAQDAIIRSALQSCPTPAVPGLLLAHRFPDAAVAGLRAQCRSDCVLTLTTHSAPASELPGPTTLWQAPLPDSSMSSVLSAIPQLSLRTVTRDGEVTGGSLDGGFPAAVGRGVQLHSLLASGQWTTVEMIGALDRMRFDACWADGSRDSWGNPLHFSVNGRGEVDRCTASRSHHLPEPEEACACAVLSDADFGAGGPRRGSLALYSHQPPAASVDGRLIAASMGPLKTQSAGLDLGGSGVGNHELSACFARASGADEAEILLRYRVDEQGIPTGWEAVWPGWVDDAARACLDVLLRTARFSCSLDGIGGEVRTTIQIRVR